MGVEANALSEPPGEYERKLKTQRNWRGPAQAVEHVVQFDTNRRTLPRFDIPTSYSLETEEIRKKVGTGVAWLSSARVVRCSVNSGNERNPYCLLNFRRNCLGNEEEGGDDVKSARPLCRGLHTCYNGEKQRVARGRP